MTAGQAISAMKPDQHGTCSWKAETEPQSQQGTSLPKHHHATGTTGKRRKRTGCFLKSSVCVCYFRRPTDVIKRLDNIGNIPQFRSRSHEHKGTQPNQAFSAYPLRAFGINRRRTSKREMIVAGSNQTASTVGPSKAHVCVQTKKGVQNTVCSCSQIDKALPVSMYIADGDSRPNSQIYIYIYVCVILRKSYQRDPTGESR